MAPYEAVSHARTDASWSPDDELAWYQKHVDRLGQEYSMIYPFLETSRRMPAFLKNAEIVESRSSSCESWVVYQEVNMDAEASALSLLCKNAMDWSVVSDGQARRISDPAKVLNANSILEDVGGDEIIGMPCLPIFGASVEYLTIYHRGEINFKSIYARETERTSCGDSSSARGVGRKIINFLDVSADDPSP